MHIIFINNITFDRTLIMAENIPFCTQQIHENKTSVILCNPDVL